MRRALLLVLVLLALPALAGAASPGELVADLANRERAEAALNQLVAMKQDAIPALGAVATDGHDLTQRGWAIVGLKRIGGAEADRLLTSLVNSGPQPVLVRTWAAAARIDVAPDLHALLSLAPELSTYPAVRRPFTQRLAALSAAGQSLDAEQLLTVSAQDVELQAAVAPLVAALPAASLVGVMLHGGPQQERMQAAGYLASRGQSAEGAAAVATAVVPALAFQPGAAQPVWSGGPLYVPGIRWTKGPATQLVGELIRWRVWADLRGRTDVASQVDQNLNSLGLGGVVGYQPSWGQTGSDVWLRVWAKVAGGREAVRKLLSEQGVAADPRYQSLLSSL